MLHAGSAALPSSSGAATRGTNAGHAETTPAREGRRRGTNEGHAETTLATEGRRRGTNEGHAEIAPAREGRRRGTSEGHADPGIPGNSEGARAGGEEFPGIFAQRDIPKNVKPHSYVRGRDSGGSHLDVGEGEF